MVGEWIPEEMDCTKLREIFLWNWDIIFNKPSIAATEARWAQPLPEPASNIGYAIDPRFEGKTPSGGFTAYEVIKVGLNCIKHGTKYPLPSGN